MLGDLLGSLLGILLGVLLGIFLGILLGIRLHILMLILMPRCSFFFFTNTSLIWRFGIQCIQENGRGLCLLSLTNIAISHPCRASTGSVFATAEVQTLGGYEVSP